MLLDETILPWGDRPAILSKEGTLTYRELDRWANRFARIFAPGDRVAIHMEKSPRAVAAMLGALRAGAIYVPIDPRSPVPRVELILKDCGVRHVVRGDTPVPAMDTPPPRPPAREDELAYLLYTSGSTGVPKGVMLSHRNALAFVEWAADLVKLGPDDRVASHAPFHFDLSVFDLYATFRRGATVVLLDESVAVSPKGMVDTIHDFGITVWYSVPSALILMLDRGELETRGAQGLRTVIFAGEVFPIPWLRRAMQAVPHARFFNFFGPTETNVCLYHEVKVPPAPDAPPVPIGVPASGDRVEVRDGELFVDGPTVMLGYWNGAPAPHPYPTGDLVEQRDGVFLFRGRRDHQIKIHGYRVELGEVEAALHRHPAVREAVAFAEDQTLTAVILPREKSLTVLEVKRHCAALLPRYMVPGDVRFVDELPRTSSGKIDRVRLAGGGA